MSPSVAWVVLALCLTASVAVSAGERLRFEYFPERHLSLQGRWQVPSITGDSEVDSRMTATVRNVTLRLFIPPAFTTPPKPVRIYLNLPASVSGLRGASGLILSWQTRGLFLSGSAQPGVRVLLFEGVVDSPILSDILDMVFKVDARDLLGPLNIEIVYEIELQ